MDANAQDQRIELFVFPDGTSVELFVFDRGPRPSRRANPAARSEAPARHAAASPCAAPPPPPKAAPARREPPADQLAEGEAHVCPHCGCRLVYPLDWERRGNAAWHLSLRCPECEARRDVVLGRRAMEALNRELYLGAAELARTADTFTRRNFEEEARKLVEALARDLILPMDF